MKKKVSRAANQHIRMIFEGSCYVEDWSNDAEIQQIQCACACACACACVCVWVCVCVSVLVWPQARAVGGGLINGRRSCLAEVTVFELNGEKQKGSGPLLWNGQNVVFLHLYSENYPVRVKINCACSFQHAPQPCLRPAPQTSASTTSLYYFLRFYTMGHVGVGIICFDVFKVFFFCSFFILTYTVTYVPAIQAKNHKKSFITWNKININWNRIKK